MTVKPKNLDEQIERLKDHLLLQGWKKHSWYVYRCFHQKNNIVSANIEREKKSKQLRVTLELHSIDLNNISHSMWQYSRKERDENKSRSLSVGKILNDYRACSLFLTQVEVGLNEDSEESSKLINQISDQLMSKYDSIDSLIALYEGSKVFKGPLLCMYISKKMFKQVREILTDENFDENSGAGDVRFGMLKYLNQNGL